MDKPNRITEWREAKGWTLEKLAEESGFSASYLSRMENDRRNVSLKNLQKIGAALGVATADLVKRADSVASPGERGVKASVPLQGYVSAGGSIDTSTEQDEPGTEYEAGLFIDVPDAVVAYQVVGMSMYPRFLPETVIVCRGYTHDAASVIGEEVAVGTKDGKRFIKIIESGSREGLFDLASTSAPTMRDVEIEWVAEIAAIIPAKQWRRLERNGQPHKRRSLGA